jgi:hypothetical protein
MHDSITNQLVVMMDPKMDEGYEPVVVYPLRVSLQLNLAKKRKKTDCKIRKADLERWIMRASCAALKRR